MADNKYITLVSADGLEFVVLREASLVSPTIKGMLRSQFSEAQTGRCTFPEIRSVYSLRSSSSAIIIIPSAMMTPAFAVFPTDRLPGGFYHQARDWTA